MPTLLREGRTDAGSHRSGNGRTYSPRLPVIYDAIDFGANCQASILSVF